MNNQGYLLLVEDNIDVQDNNKKILARYGYSTRLAMTLAEAREIMAQEAPRGIVLDIMLPDGSGLDFLHELRETSTIPVLLLTALGTPQDLIAGLKIGGDDYLPKPYDLDIFLAKMEALMRRSAIMPDTFRTGAITLNTSSLTAYVNGEDLLLSQREFALLLLFVQNEGKLMSAEYVYEKVWNAPLVGNKNAVQTTISKLRQKLEPTGYAIAIHRGKGYVFQKNEK